MITRFGLRTAHARRGRCTAHTCADRIRQLIVGQLSHLLLIDGQFALLLLIHKRVPPPSYLHYLVYFSLSLIKYQTQQRAGIQQNVRIPITSRA